MPAEGRRRALREGGVLSKSDDTRRYFDALFQRKPKDCSVVVWIKGEKKRTTYATTVDGACREAGQGVGDVYAGVGYAPRGAAQTLGPHRRPSKSDVAGIVGLWCDVDVNGGPEGKTGAAPDRAMAEELVRRAPLPPSMVVDSGYGLQPYWLFDEPWLFGTNEERQGAAELIAKWQEKLRNIAAELDPTFGIDQGAKDISRVLRVPGTANLKGGLKAPVRLVSYEDDVRYSLKDFEPFVVNVQLTLASAFQANGAAIADDIVIELRFDADPPFDRFEALSEVDDLFLSAFSRARGDDPKTRAWTPSNWDMALCDRAVRARWENQEIVDLLVASRRKHGDDLKRPDYYVRTIARARATIDVAKAEERREEAIVELEAPPVTAGDDDPMHVLGLFEQVVGVPLRAFVQYGRDPDEGGVFELVLTGRYEGQTVRIGDAEMLLNPMKVRARVMTVTGTLPPAVKRERWDKVIERLMRVRQLHESEEENAAGVLRQWLRAYLAATQGGERAEALRHNYPHVHEGRLYLHQGHLQTFVKNRYGERLQRRDLSAMLRASGFRSETVSFRRESGTNTSASLYVREIDEGSTG